MKKYFKRIQKNLKTIFGRVDKITPLEVYVVVFVIASVIFVTQYFETQSEFRFIRVEVTTSEWANSRDQNSEKAPFWISQALEVGEVERNARGSIRAELVELENYELTDDQAQIFMVVKLMAEYNQKDQSYSFNGRPLLVGEPIEFKFDQTLIPGQIVDNNFPSKGYDQGEFEVTVRYKNTESWFREQMKAGLVMTNRATGEEVAKLTEFRIEPASALVATSQVGNQLYFEKSNQLSDVRAKFRVTAQKQDGNWFFAGRQRLRVGNKIWIYLENITFPNVVIEELKYVPETNI